MNYSIQLDYNQFMKINYETIASWPFFPQTSITGANGNITAILDLGHTGQNMFRRTEFFVTEC